MLIRERTIDTGIVVKSGTYIQKERYYQNQKRE